MTQSFFSAELLTEGSAYGKGLKAPLTKDPLSGGFTPTEGAENLKNCLLNLCVQRWGERLHHEDEGIEAPLFESLEAAAAVLPFRVQALVASDPRVYNVTAAPRKLGERELAVDVTYTERATGASDNLVYPFYLEPVSGGTRGV